MSYQRALRELHDLKNKQLCSEDLKGPKVSIKASTLILSTALKADPSCLPWHILFHCGAFLPFSLEPVSLPADEVQPLSLPIDKSQPHLICDLSENLSVHSEKISLRQKFFNFVKTPCRFMWRHKKEIVIGFCCFGAGIFLGLRLRSLQTSGNSSGDMTPKSQTENINEPSLTDVVTEQGRTVLVTQQQEANLRDCVNSGEGCAEHLIPNEHLARLSLEDLSAYIYEHRDL